MAGEYDINLSNGTLLATLYPLESNGPDNRSTPRQIRSVDTGGNAFVIVGDMTNRFVAGFQFDVQNSGANDGTYTVTPAGSTFDGTNTTIPTVEPIPGTGLPLGEIQYANLDSRTTLSLPGRGSINYGEQLIDSFVHLIENFAADVSPDTNTNIGSSPFGQPLTGQWWYNTTANEEGFEYFDGTNWTRNLDIDDGALIFRDAEDGDKDIYLTGSETNLPAPFPGGASNQPGFVIWTPVNPAAEEPLFRVLSAGGAEQLRIEHDGRVETDGALYVKNVTGYGNNNIFDGNVGIGGGTFDGTMLRTLTVEGNGIYVHSDTANAAGLVLDAPSGLASYLDFVQDGVLRGNIVVNDAWDDGALALNSGTDKNITLVLGGGNVGIGETTPSRKLDVVGETELNGDVYVVDSDQIFSNGFGIESAAGALLKTGGGGNTWQFTPGNNTAAGIAVNDSLGAATFIVQEGVGTYISQYDFFVDTDTLYVDATNDRVGVNMVPTYSFDVTGSARFNNRVGINNVPPAGNVWLEVTGDVQANSQFRGSDQTAANPTYTFTSDLSSGIYYIPGTASVGIATAGVERWRVDGTGQTFNVDTDISGALTVSGSTQFGDDPTVDTMVINSDLTINDPTGTVDINALTVDVSNDLTIAGNLNMTGGTASLGVSVANILLTALSGVNITSSNNITINDFTVESDGTLNVAGVTDYELLVTDDDDIPNKKYIDDQVATVAPKYENQSAVAGGTAVITTTVNTVPAAGGEAYLQVFVNGILQIETAGFNVTGANQITLTSPPSTPFDVTIFSWR